MPLYPALRTSTASDGPLFREVFLRIGCRRNVPICLCHGRLYTRLLPLKPFSRHPDSLVTLAPEHVIDVEDVVRVLVVVPVISSWLARLREDASRVEGELVPEVRVYEMIGLRELGRQGFNRLWCGGGMERRSPWRARAAEEKEVHRRWWVSLHAEVDSMAQAPEEKGEMEEEGG